MKSRTVAEKKAIQSRLVALGFDLPRFGVDGAITVGGETWRALESFAEAYVPADLGADGLTDGPEFESVVAALLASPPLRTGGKMLDLTETHQQKHVSKTRIRTWKDIDQIVLHQTGYAMRSEASWKTLQAHILVPFAEPQNPSFAVVNPLVGFIWHAQGLSHRSVGIEVCGNFHGIRDNSSTLWRPNPGYNETHHGPHYLGENQRDNVRSAIRYVCEYAERNGGAIRDIYAHRQSSKDRAGDPGEEIWEACGLWAEQELGLVSHPGQVFGTGRKLPDAWTGRSDGVRYV